MAINATLGTVEYRENGIIAVPVTFPENVIAPSKSIFEITYVSGDALTDIEYRLVGQDTAFAVVIEMPLDRKGSFQIAANGDVLKVSTGVWENLSIATPKTVSYNTIVPRLVDYDIPADYTPGAIFDVRIAFNVLVTGLHLNNVQDVFVLEGAANLMGTPTPYKWTGATPSDLRAFLQAAVPDDLTGTDWQQLASPPAGNPTPGMSNFDEDGQWHGETGQYFLVRWTVDANTTGIFNMTLREGMVRGPIGS